MFSKMWLASVCFFCRGKTPGDQFSRADEHRREKERRNPSRNHRGGVTEGSGECLQIPSLMDTITARREQKRVSRAHVNVLQTDARLSISAIDVRSCLTPVEFTWQLFYHVIRAWLPYLDILKLLSIVRSDGSKRRSFLYHHLSALYS